MSIGTCDCCDRRDVPVASFQGTAAYPEGVACFICQGDDDPDPYCEMPETPRCCKYPLTYTV